MLKLNLKYISFYKITNIYNIKKIKNFINIYESLFLIFIIKKFIKNLYFIKFFIKKKEKNLITLIKAPMAHKKFSKEQINYSYYNLNIRILFKIKILHNNLIFLLFFFNKIFNNVETNLLFLKFLNIKYKFNKKIKL